MINKSYEEILQKIVESSSLSKEELESKIEKKIKELDGFVTKEGAAHIVATELKVKVFDKKTPTSIKIKDLVPGMINASVAGVVLQKYSRNDFEKNGRKGSVINLLVGDQTGKTRLVFWDTHLIEKVENEIKEGDTVLVKNVRIRQSNNFIDVHASNDSKIEINPEGYTIKEVASSPAAYSDNYSKSEIKSIKENNSYEITGVITQVFEPFKFMACSECNKKVAEDGKCPEHPNSDVNERIILNFFLDDGTSNIRCTHFCTKDDCLINLDSDFDSEKNNLLLDSLTIKGRSVTNNMTNALELRVNNLNKLDPVKEIKEVLKDAL